MNPSIFERMQEHDYEQIFFCQEKMVGLKAIIVIHDTTLGPAMGACACFPTKPKKLHSQTRSA
jgi:leucine dehydrogenase